MDVGHVADDAANFDVQRSESEPVDGKVHDGVFSESGMRELISRAWSLLFGRTHVVGTLCSASRRRWSGLTDALPPGAYG